MYLPLLRFYGRVAHRTTYNVAINIKYFSEISNKANNNLFDGSTASTMYPDYKVIYCFPYIKHVAVANLLKCHQTWLTAIGSPMLAALYLKDFVSASTATSVCLCGLVICIFFHSFTWLLCKQFVGLIYLKEDEAKVIISYLNYWGYRKDINTTVAEITPISEMPVTITDPAYKKFSVDSYKKPFKVNIRYGKILDEKRFTHVFGAYT